MDTDTSTRLIPLRLPLTTMLLCGAAGAVLALPPLQAMLIYNRAAIDSGETWRLITGNLVHLSPSHFFYDVIALFIVGTLIEIRRYRYYSVLCLASAALIGVTLYFVEPEILIFGGMSGVVTAAVTFLCLHGLHEVGVWRWLCLATLVCLVTKLGVELVLGSSFLLLIGAENQGFVPVPVSHVLGAVTALTLFAFAQKLELHAAPITSR